MTARVLIVDDALFMRTMLRNIFVESGFEVGEAGNGVEAVERYRQLGPDLTTMDIVMPERNGIEALKLIVAYDPKARVVMCSALGQESLIIEALDAGARDFIVKPFKPAKVVEVAQKVLAASREGGRSLDLTKYRQLFLDECREHLQLLNSELLRLEEEGGPAGSTRLPGPRTRSRACPDRWATTPSSPRVTRSRAFSTACARGRSRLPAAADGAALRGGRHPRGARDRGRGERCPADGRRGACAAPLREGVRGAAARGGRLRGAGPGARNRSHWVQPKSDSETEPVAAPGASPGLETAIAAVAEPIPAGEPVDTAQSVHKPRHPVPDRIRCTNWPVPTRSPFMSRPDPRPKPCRRRSSFPRRSPTAGAAADAVLARLAEVAPAAEPAAFASESPSAPRDANDSSPAGGAAQTLRRGAGADLVAARGGIFTLEPEKLAMVRDFVRSGLSRSPARCASPGPAALGAGTSSSSAASPRPAWCSPRARRWTRCAPAPAASGRGAVADRRPRSSCGSGCWRSRNCRSCSCAA